MNLRKRTLRLADAHPGIRRKITPLIHRKAAVKIPNTAREWELYSSVDGADEFAREIAKEARSALKTLGRKVRGKHWDSWDSTGKGNKDILRAAQEAYRDVYGVMESRSGYGATDTEPRANLRWLIAEFLAEKLRLNNSAKYEISNALW